MTTFDDVDTTILQNRYDARYFSYKGRPRVGDFIQDTAGTMRRVSHCWEGWEDEKFPDGYQTSGQNEGSYYLNSSGGCEYSGGLYPSEPWDSIAWTPNVKLGSVWIFHHNEWRSHNGVYSTMLFPVWKLAKEFHK